MIYNGYLLDYVGSAGDIILAQNTYESEELAMKERRNRSKMMGLVLRGVYALGRTTVCATSRIGTYEPEEDYEAYKAVMKKEGGEV